MTRRSIALLALAGFATLLIAVGAEAQLPGGAQMPGGTSLPGGVSGLSSPLNINTASATDLGKLPGVGDVGAQQIVAGRPFSSTTDLVDKNILTQAVFDQVKSLITVK